MRSKALSTQNSAPGARALLSVTVIIPIRAPNAYLWETLEYLEQLDYPPVEIVVLPDQDSAACAWAGRHAVSFIPTGPASPGKKRDFGAGCASGELLAFLDDDAFPACDWLRRAVPHFADPAVGAVGGPAVTPPADDLLQQASGLVYQSWLGGGAYAYRYLPQRQRRVDDYPTCNLIVRRAAFEAAGGFDTDYWPGEDTKLCLALVRDLGLRILYEPGAIVCHHRRPLFGGHLRQVRSYALHRGYFVKRFPETSRRVSYFLPTALVAALLGGCLLSLLRQRFRRRVGLGIAAYLAAAVVSAAATSRSVLLTPLVAAGIVATHLAYGFWFFVGLVAPKLGEEE
jgi:cellulose synthase/poly-beta-1,6-N-acetylglucosamine synthase-like glycosyltransferase